MTNNMLDNIFMFDSVFMFDNMIVFNNSLRRRSEALCGGGGTRSHVPPMVVATVPLF